MKKKIFALVALLACVTMGASAQVYVGGSLGFTSSKVDQGGHDQDGSSYKFIPEIGYQLDDDLAVGLQIGYAHGYASFGSLNVTDVKALMNTVVSTNADLNEDDMKLNSFTIAPYLRYNVLKFDRVKFFIEGGVGYTSIKTDQAPAQFGGNEAKLNLLEISFRPGVSIDLSSNISLMAKIGSLGYMEAKEKESDQKLTRFGLDIDTYNLLFGLNFKF